LKAIAEFGKRRQHNLMLSMKKGNEVGPNQYQIEKSNID
jgi:hypothetical protein